MILQSVVISRMVLSVNRRVFVTKIKLRLVHQCPAIVRVCLATSTKTVAQVGSLLSGEFSYLSENQHDDSCSNAFTTEQMCSCIP